MSNIIFKITSKLQISCILLTNVPKTCQLQKFQQKRSSFLVTVPRATFTYSRFLRKRANSSLPIHAIASTDFIAPLWWWPYTSLCQRVIFHPPINSPVGPDFSARNPIARFLPAQNKTRRSRRGHQVHENPVVTCRSIRIWSMAVVSLLDFTRTISTPRRALSTSSPLAAFAVSGIWSYSEKIANMRRYSFYFHGFCQCLF